MTSRRTALAAAPLALAAIALPAVAPPAAAAAQSPRLTAADYLSVGATLTVKDLAKSALLGIDRLLVPPGVPDGLAAVNVYANVGMLIGANQFVATFDNLPAARSSWAQFLAAFADLERFGTDLANAVYAGDTLGVDTARDWVSIMLSRLDAALHAYALETGIDLGA